MNIQLFYQPSLSASYIRNNRFMSAYDFTLSFPQIPLSFGISSDLAAGWSKLIYEQVLMNKQQQKIEVEIQGLGEKEAFIVEQCIKLLFGFKIEFCIPDIWQALKVCDIVGITQSPQVEGITVQEQLLSYALQNIQQINLIEGLDYTLQLQENGGEGLIVHRAEIRQLAQIISDKIKELIIESKFEILINYAHEQSIESTNNIKQTKFLIKDLKREHYIQLRTLFYNFVNQQNIELSQNQNIVKILFEELDQQFELDSYINKYFEEVAAKMSTIDNFINQMDKKFEQQIDQINQKITTEITQLNEKNVSLEKSLQFAHKKIEEMQLNTIIQQYQLKIFCFANGVIKYENGNNLFYIHTENPEGNKITCLKYIKDNLIAVGMQKGKVLLFENDNLINELQRNNCNSDVIYMHNQNNYLICSYSDCSYCIWWNQQLIFTETLESIISYIFSNISLGNFLLLGIDDGTILFIYINESKPQLATDHVKALKSQNSKILKIDIIPKINDLIVVGHQDSIVNIWNWEQEIITTTIKIDGFLLDFKIYINNKEQKILRALTQGGYISEHTIEQFSQFIQQIYVSKQCFQFVNDGCLTNTGQLYQLKDGPICCNHPYLGLQSTFLHHQDTCVYGLLLINYPYIASSADDKSIIIFNLKSQEILSLKGHQSYIRAIGLLQSNKHLVSGSYDTTIKIWEISSGICQNTLNGHTKPVLCIQVLNHTNNIFVSGGEDCVLRAWNWKTNTCIWKIETKSEIWSLLSIEYHYTILSGNKDGQIQVINIGQQANKSQIISELNIHKSYVNCIIHLNGSIVASGSSDTTIAITDFYTGDILRKLIGHSNIVWSIQLIDQNVIASSSTEGKIKFWNWKENLCLNSQVVANGSIYTLLKLPYTNKLLGGTAQGEILQWKICKELPIQL